MASTTPKQDGAKAASMLLALGRLRPASFEMMVLDVADSPAVSSSASPKQLFNDDKDTEHCLRKLGGDCGIVVGHNEGAKARRARRPSARRPSTSTSTSSSSSIARSSSTKPELKLGASVVASGPVLAGKPDLHFGSSGGFSHAGEDEGEEQQKKLQDREEEPHQPQDNSNSPSFVLGEVHGWCDSDSSPCCSSPGSLSLSHVQPQRRNCSGNFHLVAEGRSHVGSAPTGGQPATECVPCDRIELDLNVQDCSPLENCNRLGGFFVPGQLEPRKRMLARSQQCVVCMEMKEHTFVPAHRETPAQQCQGHRFCTDCWKEYLGHRLRACITMQMNRQQMINLPCPVCRTDIYVPDSYCSQLHTNFPKSWREFLEPPPAVPFQEVPSADAHATNHNQSGDLSLFTLSTGPGSLRTTSGSLGWSSPPGRMPLVQAWQPEAPQPSRERSGSSRGHRQHQTELRERLDAQEELVTEEQVEHGDVLNCRFLWGHTMRCLRGIFPMINAGVAQMDRRGRGPGQEPPRA